MRRRRSAERSSSFSPPPVRSFTRRAPPDSPRLKPYRASSANLLGLAPPDLPLRLALTVRTEKEQQVLATALCSILPTPVRAGKHSRLPTYLRHGSNHLNQDASNRELQWSVRLVNKRTRASPVREPPLQDTTRLGDEVFPCAGKAIA